MPRKPAPPKRPAKTVPGNMGGKGTAPLIPPLVLEILGKDQLPDLDIEGDSKKGGRPSKLTPEITQTIAIFIRAGNDVLVSAKAARISRATLYAWMDKGRDPKAPKKYRIFLDTIEAAVAQAEVRDVFSVDKAAKAGNWQAAAWKLSRRFPARWGEVKVDPTISSGATPGGASTGSAGGGVGGLRIYRPAKDPSPTDEVLEVEEEEIDGVHPAQASETDDELEDLDP